MDSLLPAMEQKAVEDGAERLLELRDALGRAPVESVPLRDLHVVGSPRSTVVCPDYTRELAALDGPFASVLVHRASMSVVDGVHRVRAARLRGDTHVGVRFFEGTEEQGRLLAVALNVRHGRPLSMDERLTAVRAILAGHQEWADRSVAALAAVAPGTVAEVRRELYGEPAPDAARLGRDGRSRPVDPDRGRILAADLLTRHPDSSLRQIAKQSGISPTTVSDVRARLARGESPTLRKTPARQPMTRRGPAEAERTAHVGEILDTLRRDPSLRLNDTGRSVLRLLDVSAAFLRDGEAIAAGLPPHCVHALARLARGYSRSWAVLADQLGSA
ncbi:hypothetical protein LRE75_24485 [Streptomyces sp. 372A]|uniref:hypothetical protein n=1 Tax=Streptomyces sp. SAS_281 TaxID=3412744 RepID=UPI00403D27D8